MNLFDLIDLDWNKTFFFFFFIIINIMKSVHITLVFVTPPKTVFWKCWFLMTPYPNRNNILKTYPERTCFINSQSKFHESTHHGICQVVIVKLTHFGSELILLSFCFLEPWTIYSTYKLWFTHLGSHRGKSPGGTWLWCHPSQTYPLSTRLAAEGYCVSRLDTTRSNDVISLFTNRSSLHKFLIVYSTESRLAFPQIGRCFQ